MRDVVTRRKNESVGCASGSERPNESSRRETFLIDYRDGVEATRQFYEDNGGDQIRWIVPVPALAEVLVGEGNLPNGDVDGVRADLLWVNFHPIDERTAVTAGQIAPGDPYLDGPDALIAAVGRELNAPVVSRDGDLIHEATKQVVAIEEY